MSAGVEEDGLRVARDERHQLAAPPMPRRSVRRCSVHSHPLHSPSVRSRACVISACVRGWVRPC